MESKSFNCSGSWIIVTFRHLNVKRSQAKESRDGQMVSSGNLDQKKFITCFFLTKVLKPNPSSQCRKHFHEMKNNKQKKIAYVLN